MGINYKKKVSEKVMKKFGVDVTLDSIPGTHRAIIKRSNMALDNAARAHSAVHLVSFLKPTPAHPMNGVTVTEIDTGDQFILGQAVEDNGYIKQFDSSLK